MILADVSANNIGATIGTTTIAISIKSKKNPRIKITIITKINWDQNKDVKLIGNIGIPVLSRNKINHSTIFVIEASSYQIDYSQYFKTDYALILNIRPDHLERHKSIQNYASAKFKLILNQNKNFYAFVENNKYLNYNWNNCNWCNYVIIRTTNSFDVNLII